YRRTTRRPRKASKRLARESGARSAPRRQLRARRQSRSQQPKPTGAPASTVPRSGYCRDTLVVTDDCRGNFTHTMCAIGSRYQPSVAAPKAAAEDVGSAVPSRVTIAGAGPCPLILRMYVLHESCPVYAYLAVTCAPSVTTT